MIQKLGDLRDGRARPPGAPAERNNEDRTARVAESAPQYATPKSSAEISAVEIWKQLSVKIPAQKAFVRNAIGAAHVLGIEGRNFLLGFSPGDTSLMEILGTQANRKFLETLLREIAGKDLTVKLSVNDEVPPKPEKTSRAGEFKEDPLIQEAIEMFKGEIKS